MVSNPELLPFPIASTTGELADANQIVVDSAALTGLIQGSGEVQTALHRVDATGLGAPIFLFTGNFAAAGANISDWFNDQATRHLQGASGQANGLRTFDLPGTSALTTVFDRLVALGLPELYRITVSYLGGVSGAAITVNRLLVRPRSSPSPQIDGRASVTLAHGDTVTFEITRTSGTISSYVVIAEGRLQGAAGAGDVLNDIQLQTPTWNAIDNTPLPGTGQVQNGWAFLVVNAPRPNGLTRFGRVLFNDDLVIWNNATFTQWSDTANWFVLAAGDFYRLTLAGQTFLQDVGTKTVLVRGNNYADDVGEIRIQLYENPGDYSAGDINVNGQIDQYTNTSDLLGYRIAVRLQGSQSGLASTVPNLNIYAEDSFGNFTLIANLGTDFTNQGNFGAETDYLADADYNYRAGDILRIYVTSSAEFNTISDYQAIDNVDDAAVEEIKLSSPVRNKLNARGVDYELPPALQALNTNSRVFSITHTNFRRNNVHVFPNNVLAALKRAPTTFPNTAGAFANEITGSATAVGDPSPVTAIQDVSRITNNTMTGAGITGAQFPITYIDDNNWRLIIGGWMYYPTSLPTSYNSIFQVRERSPSGTVYRDIFGMGPSGLTFKQRATTGSTTPVGIRHELISTNGLLEENLTAANLSTAFRVYTSGTYLVQVRGFNSGALTGGQGQDYVVTAVNQDQAATSVSFDLGVGTQSLNISYDAQRSLYGGREHVINIEATSLIAGVDTLVIDIIAASTTVTTSEGNTYNDITLSDGHAAPDRLMRYIVTFRSVNGTEDGNLEAAVAFFGYDLNGNPRYFEENTLDLLYPALDLRWQTCRYGGTSGVHQNVQSFFLNPDTPLIEYPTHDALNGWLSSHDNKNNDYVWGNIDGPDADTEAVYFPEAVNFPNLIFEDDNRVRYVLGVNTSGDPIMTQLT